MRIGASAMHSLAIPWTAQMRRMLARLQRLPWLQRLQSLAERRCVQLFVVGGTLRDLCLGRAVQDVDLALSGHVTSLARAFARELGAAYVPMDPARGEVRVVYRKRHIVDFSHLKGEDIAQDLGRRDFTMNALACPLAIFLTSTEPPIIDPYGGWRDIQTHVVRMVSPRSLVDDPLRVLRAFRFAADLEWTIDATTLATMEPAIPRLVDIAAERLHSELLKLFAAPRSSQHVVAMAHLELLDVLFPELAATRGMAPGPSVPGDLFEQALRTYQSVEDLINAPASYAPAIADAIAAYMHAEERQALLKWAALLHSIGTPGPDGASREWSMGLGHAGHAAQLWERIAARFKLSRARTEYVGVLLTHHQRPFELAALDAQGLLTLRLVHRWFKDLGEDVLGAFVLAIGTALANRHGSMPAPDVITLEELAARLWKIYHRRILPVIDAPRLVTGDDLQAIFGLPPGPRFKTLLEDIELAQVEGRIQTREDALRWLQQQLRPC
jgi:poly(A) polymerase